MDLVPAEAHWHMVHVKNHARGFRMMGNRTMEDVDSDEADFQQLLGRVDGCEILCGTMGTCRDRRTTQICDSLS